MEEGYFVNGIANKGMQQIFLRKRKRKICAFF